MPYWEIETPTGEPLFRVGRGPDPLAWVPWEHIGEGRFDDPEPDPRKKRYRVLYAGNRRAGFLESLADFRPQLNGLVTKEFTRSWLDSRRVAEFSLTDLRNRWRWIDLRAPEVHQIIRHEFSPILLKHGFPDFDISTATCEKLEVTQQIGAWCFDLGYGGIVYMSRLDYSQVCWAVFERSDGDAVGFDNVDINPITDGDADLRAVVDLFSLPWPPAP